MQAPPAVLAALELVPIPRPFDLDAYMRQVQRVRGRRVHLHELPATAAGAICGLWLATEKADHIYVAPGATGVLRVNILLHEISHMLLGHGRADEAAAALARLLHGGGNTQGVRARYDSTEERHAEMLATLILTRASEPAQTGDGLSMLENVMGYGIPERW
ncbi:hypothetical protein ACQP10_38370 (plasmid) [Streptosporangium sandarakinum]|uniref:hypothetical protein n=1 Tax=Streptosporangium sandarakinum TaxID=1260955 RepID=UPI003D937921